MSRMKIDKRRKMDKSNIGIMFDVDGTLWDSSENVAKSWEIAIERESGVKRDLTAELFRNLMGTPMDEIGRIMFPDESEEERVRLLKACELFEIDYLRENPPKSFDGVWDTLKALHEDYSLFIISNCQSGYIELLIDACDLGDFIDDKLCFGDNGLGKGENIRESARRNGLERYFYVGDIQRDYDATVEGGGEFIFAEYGFGNVEGTPSIKDIRELPELIKTLV